MFVMDSSSSIWIEDYKKQLQFARKLVANFDIGQTNSHVRVGAITFSRTAHLDIPLGRYVSKRKLQKAILKIPYRTGETNTAEALRLLRREIEPKMKVFTAPFMVIVITDGKSRDTWSTQYEAHLLHKLGVHIYAIGVGPYYDIKELTSIASDPVRNIRLVSSYSALENIAKIFGVKTCEGELKFQTILPLSPLVFCLFHFFVVLSLMLLTFVLANFLFVFLFYVIAFVLIFSLSIQIYLC